MTFYEKLFFELDVDYKLYLNVGEAEVFLSYVAFDMAPEEVSEAVQQADRLGVVDDAMDGRLMRIEFVELCTQLLWRYSEQQLERGALNFHAVRACERQERRTRYRTLGKRIDRWCLAFVVPIYTCCLLVLFVLDFNDDIYAYAPASNRSVVFQTADDVCLPPRNPQPDGTCAYNPPEMYSGIYSLSIAWDSALKAIFAPVALFAFFYLTRWYARWATRAEAPSRAAVALANMRCVSDYEETMRPMTSLFKMATVGNLWKALSIKEIPPQPEQDVSEVSAADGTSRVSMTSAEPAGCKATVTIEVPATEVEVVSVTRAAEEDDQEELYL